MTINILDNPEQFVAQPGPAVNPEQFMAPQSSSIMGLRIVQVLHGYSLFFIIIAVIIGIIYMIKSKKTKAKRIIIGLCIIIVPIIIRWGLAILKFNMLLKM